MNKIFYEQSDVIYHIIIKSSSLEIHVGISMGSLPHYPQVFPNRMKISEFVDHSEA
jgi:hypothetical protein